MTPPLFVFAHEREHLVLSAEHFAGFGGLEHGAQVIAVLLGQFHAVGDRRTV